MSRMITKVYQRTGETMAKNACSKRHALGPSRSETRLEQLDRRFFQECLPLIVQSCAVTPQPAKSRSSRSLRLACLRNRNFHNAPCRT